MEVWNYEAVEKETWKIENDKSAEWALLELKEQEAELQRYLNVCETMIQEYKFKAEQAKEKHQQKTAFLRSQLQQYFETVERKATKTQETYKLPSGTLKKKFGGIAYARIDDMLIDWLKKSNKQEFIKTKESVDWASFKKTLEVNGENAITEDGEIVEGVTVGTLDDEFKIEFE